MELGKTSEFPVLPTNGLWGSRREEAVWRVEMNRVLQMFSI